ncbi:MBL fold metallo-hydrolase [Methylobacterium indicum]|uniref:MBL fold metallo-hydrolase n=1 Tax=Methylobacterium indicum TaxID=1775910 RepID=UPI002435DC77|nr:MBL fold metallo-hydrolase [Methylobacterium indicum]
MRIAARTQNAFGCTSGPWTIWSLSDGHVDLPASSLRDPDDEPQDSRLADETVRLSVNCFLIQLASQDPALIDCGAGGSWDDTMGYLGRAFEEAGLSPASIRTLLFTHAHNDHINGLVSRDGNETFPNLNRILIPEAATATFNADASLSRFRTLLTPINHGDDVIPGVTAVALPGHAPGHTGYRLDTGEDTILICGDIVHVPARQFAHPTLTWAYDDDQATARMTRLRVLADAAATGTWLAGAHLGRPGMGQVERIGDGYRFEEAG